MGGIIVRDGLQQKFQPIWSLIVIIDDVSKLVEGHNSIDGRKT